MGIEEGRCKDGNLGLFLNEKTSEKQKTLQMLSKGLLVVGDTGFEP